MYDIDGRFTVRSLKHLCTGLNLPLSGTKGVLQERLRKFFDMLLNRNDTARFDLGKSLAEAERGYAYGPRATSRYDIYRSRSNDYSRPNGMYAVSSVPTTSNNNSWGMSSVYQNVRLRTIHLFPANK
jgi:hypothetical protein